MVKETKFYDILQVSPDASATDIRRAYRALALKYHPDKSDDPQAQEKFKEVAVAYECLSDPEKRAKYDEHGEKGMDRPEMNPEDFFSAFMGGRQSKPEKPRDINHELGVTLDTLYTGKTVKLAIVRGRFCGPCCGTGTNKPGITTTCPSCQGKGERVVLRQLAPGMMQQMRMPCQNCGGTGCTIKDCDRCEACKGARVVQEKKIFEVVITPGMASGDHVCFEGEGENAIGMPLAGDINIIIREKPHDVFTRKNQHLIVSHVLSLSEALTGFNFTLKHLDGRVLVISSSPGECIDPQKFWIVSHEGMPIKGGSANERGHLQIQFSVAFPDRIDPATFSQLQSILGAPKTPKVPSDAKMCYVMKSATDPCTSSRSNEQEDENEGYSGQGVRCPAQ